MVIKLLMIVYIFDKFLFINYFRMYFIDSLVFFKEFYYQDIVCLSDIVFGLFGQGVVILIQGYFVGVFLLIQLVQQSKFIYIVINYRMELYLYIKLKLEI